jgi:hypothetical protein
MTEEALLRIEHKLDVIISYLHGMTNVPPQDIPKPLPGMGGETDGRCPITGTKISYNFVPETGALVRTDGLLNGVPKSLPVPEPPAWIARENSGDVSDGGYDD